MSARALLALLDKPCLLRHGDGTTSEARLHDAWRGAGDVLRCTLDVELMDHLGRVTSQWGYFPASRVWLLVDGSYVRADELATRGEARAAG